MEYFENLLIKYKLIILMTLYWSINTSVKLPTPSEKKKQKKQMYLELLISIFR